MRHLLLTLMALLTAGAAMANCYFYIDDFEVNAGSQITVPVKAHFDGRLNAFSLEITYPAGLTPVRAIAGRDMTVSYVDKNAQNNTKAVGLLLNADFTRFIAAIDISGYWNGPNGFETYGAVKWEAGNYDEMILLTLQVDSNFSGGNISVHSDMSSGNDARGGTIGGVEMGDTECHVSLKSSPDVSPGNYFYLDDFEVNAGSQITVPVKAHFDGRLNGFDVTITYPDGITPVRAVAGRDMTLTYIDRYGEEQTTAISLHQNDEHTRFIGAIEFAGYWYGPSGFEMYGAVKWEAGDYEEMFLLTLQVDENFRGGNIQVHSELSSGMDARGGTIGRLVIDDTDCLVSLKFTPDAKTPNPFIAYDSETATVTVWSDYEGAMVSVYIDDEDMGQHEGMFTYQFPRTDVAQEYEVMACAKAENMLVSDFVTLTFTVEPLPEDPDPEPTDNNMTLADAQVVRGNTVVIPLSLTNVIGVTAFQTDIYLPEGFEMMKQDGEFLIDPSGRLSDHIIMANTRPDGSVRILCYSPMINPIAGNDGELLYITVVVPDDAVGDYTLSLKNTALTTTEYEEVRCAETTSTLTVLPFIVGDANNSGSVTVTDVVLAARYVLGYDTDVFEFGAADMNGDGQITVTDVVLIARLVHNPQGGAPLHAPASINVNDAMSGEDFNIAAGETRTVTITLDNSIDYTAFQLDMMLPDGLTASNFRLTDRAASHVLDANTLADGSMRVMCYSAELATIDGSEGALLTFDVTAVGNVEGAINVDGIEMVTADCQTMMLDTFSMNVNAVSAVNEIAAATRIYSDGHDIIVESPVDQVLTVSDIAGRAQQVKVNAGHNVIANPGNGVYVVVARGKTAKLMLK